MRNSTLSEEKQETLKGKRFIIISPPDVSSIGCNINVVVNSLLPYSLPINRFSIFKVDFGNSHAVSIPGGRKGKNTYLQISGQSKMHASLTVFKIMLKTEDTAHISHQHIPQGPLQKPLKPEASKKLFTHLPIQPTCT